MENKILHSQRAAAQTALFRWVALAVAVVMLLGVAPLAVIGAGAACVAAYNGLLQYIAAVPERYVRRGGLITSLVSGADIAILTLAISAYQPALRSLYLLYALVILASGYVSMRPQIIGAALAGCLAGNFLATLAAEHSLALPILMQFVLKPSLVLGVAAVVAVSLYVFKRRDDDLQRRDKKLSTLLEFGTRFTSGADAARVMEQTLRAAIHNTDATAGYIMLFNETNSQLVTEVAVSLGEERAIPASRALGEGIEGYVAETCKPLMLAHNPQGRKTPAAVETDFDYDAEAALCFPPTEGGPNAQGSTVIGVFVLLHHHIGSQFNEEDLDLIRTLAGLSTMAIVNSRLYEDLRTSFMRSLHVLAKTLESRDAYTQGHSYRVSELCVMIAEKLRVAPEVVDNLRNGALLHDVGKIGIPDAILRKPERLTEEEFEIMKQHPVIGWEICQPLGLGEEILMLIRNHHEKLDGTGYPDGLRLGELPLPLRIICVADAFDAMSSSRPYRKCMDAETRNAQLNRFAGIQFDPIVIEALKGLMASGALDELYREHWQEVTSENVVEVGLPPEKFDGIVQLKIA